MRSRRLRRPVLTAFWTATALITALVAAAVGQTVPRSAQPAARESIPHRLSDAEYWKLVSDISEPGGTFRNPDNFTSNENEVGRVFTLLQRTGVRGGVYLGVGPEQNFSYIAAIQPAMAFICDIRRQAVMQHLMFKAVFELSADRADFISLLFSKPRPKGLDRATFIQDIWNAYRPVAVDPTTAMRNHARIVDRLTRVHEFPLTSDERSQLDYVIDAFVDAGPSIMTNTGGGGFGRLTFADLTGWSTDDAGRVQSFLSTEEHYQTVKALQDKNLIVAVSGDFGGPKAIRAIGEYLRGHNATVSAFYVSNVEQYLFQDRKDAAFYGNTSTLPITDGTVFIRPYALRQGLAPQPLCAMSGFLAVARAGRVGTNNQALACAG